VIALKAIAGQSVRYFDDPRGGCDGDEWTHCGAVRSLTAVRQFRAGAARQEG